MDEHFDELTRALAMPMPRRRAVLLMAGTIAGAAGALMGLTTVRAGAEQRYSTATCSHCTCNDDGNGRFFCIDEHRITCKDCQGCNTPDDAGKVCS